MATQKASEVSSHGCTKLHMEQFPSERHPPTHWVISILWWLKIPTLIFQRGRHTLTIKSVPSRAPYNQGISQIPASLWGVHHTPRAPASKAATEGCHLDLQLPPSLKSGRISWASPLPPPQTLESKGFTCFGCPPELSAEGEGKTSVS